jgi:uncharacterized protein (TIGR02452 family)
MSRADRAAIAQQTLAILEAGGYVLPDGRRITISNDVRKCVEGTRLLQPGELRALRAQVLSRPSAPISSTIEIRNESTLSGIQRLLHEGCAPVVALNFASANNPGGGFLNGSQAQEESLARSSGLYASLMHAREFYKRNRRDSSPLHPDEMIFSPHCPVFRDDAGSLLSDVHCAAFVSSAAPNAGALKDSRPHDMHLIQEVLQRRAEHVLALMASQGYRNIILGAWGCGVFRNDPQVVAEVFMKLLRSPDWTGRFSRVAFSIIEPPKSDLIEVFKAAAARHCT